MPSSADATQLLVEGRQSQKAAVDKLVTQVHTELRQIAHRLLQKRPADGVLDTTELVHEAYLKLIDQSQVTWEDRAHFQALSARVMRQILVNHFHRQRADKRGGHLDEVPLQEGEIPVGDRGKVLLAVDEALGRLADHDARKAQVVQYRFFGGMTHRAIAEVLDISTRTVQRDWRAARAWLAHILTEGDAPEATDPGAA
mgnify:CR=1 FL=1